MTDSHASCSLQIYETTIRSTDYRQAGRQPPGGDPKKLHDRLGLKPGDYLEVEEQQGRVVMTPKTLIDSRVHAAFRESMEDFKAGRYSGPFDTAEQATASLRKTARARRASNTSRR